MMNKRNNELDILAIYKKEIERYPILSKQEEAELLRKAQEGEEPAKERVVECYLKLVAKLARKFSGKAEFEGILPGDIELELIQEGSIGLMKAVLNYDFYDTSNASFSTFATSYIKFYFLKYLSKSQHRVYIPNHTFLLIDSVRNAKHRLEIEGGKVDIEDIAKKANMKVEKVRKLLKYAELHKEESYDRPAFVEEDDSPTIIDMQKSEIGLAETEVLLNQLRADVNEILELYLNKEEKKLVFLRFNKDLTYEKIGNSIGCSEGNARRKVLRVCKKLEPVFRGRNMKDYICAA